ncbi:MAG TPA: expansin EXLX1 family cellulose-binding protein [Polyangiaceae bacterium]|nr:expansin EXLX1 family cellulose-binding protein [Polyangiaceae bacterium]
MTVRVSTALGTLLGCGLALACDGGAGEGSGGSRPSGGGTALTVGAERQGEATYYAATGEGACMFDASPSDLNVAALNSPDWAGSAWCGACADVTGPSGSVRIRIVDLCPECASGDLDLSPEAFQQLAAIELGRVPITWRLVTCDVAGPVSYRYKDGANQWWTAVQVLNHRVPVQSMEYSKDGASYSPMVRQDYNYFLTESGFGEGTTRVRITSVDGQVLEDELPPVQEYLVVEGTAQFQ